MQANTQEVILSIKPPPMPGSSTAPGSGKRRIDRRVCVLRVRPCFSG